MTLKQAVEDPASPLRQFFDAHLPSTKTVRAAWRRDVHSTAEILASAERVITLGVERRYPFDEVGHAASMRLALLFSSEIRVPTPSRHPVQHEPWVAARDFSRLLDEVLSDSVGFEAQPPEQEQRLLRICYLAGLFDQLYRIGAQPGMPLLEVTSLIVVSEAAPRDPLVDVTQ